MGDCDHSRLVLLTPPGPRLRCRHCHLTIAPGELEADYCPECFEAEGVKRNDFDAIEKNGAGSVRYRCEDCGALIEDSEE